MHSFKSTILPGVLLIFIHVFSAGNGYLAAQAPPASPAFTPKVVLPATPVRDQHKTNTCWSFAALSFFESELIRTGKGRYDLSEMYVVWHTYQQKAKKFARMHGHINFTGGGAFNDVSEVISRYGMLPEKAYSGLAEGTDRHEHLEMDAALEAYMDSLIRRNRILPGNWFSGYLQILETYLGTPPAGFTDRGMNHTPGSYASSLGLDMEDYVLVSSFTHHPFYQPFILEVPDNWSWGRVYNVPLEDLSAIIDHCLEQGYTLAWAADVSEPGFDRNTAVATVRQEEQDQDYALLNEAGELEIRQALPEQSITQEMRQAAFDNYETTDDHGMHIIGSGTDPFGKKFYLVKNSWGTDAGPSNGYYYVSEAYVAYKTISIMVHKESMPPGIRTKLKL